MQKTQPNLTKRDIINSVHEKLNLKREDVSAVVYATFEALKQSLDSGQNIEIRDFGSFVHRVTKPRIGRNPAKPTETKQIPARRIIKFKPGKDLKAKIVKGVA